MTAIELIAAERQRQITEEGWTPEHDRQWKGGQLAMAATCYVMPPIIRRAREIFKYLWPWEMGGWKPSPNDRKRELIKAAALIVAEIDRLEAEEGGGNGIS